MNTLNVSKIGNRAAWALGAVLIFACNAAQACPGCKQNMVPGANGTTPPMSGASLGFSLSIFALIALVTTILGGLGYMMYRSSLVLAAQHRAMLSQDELEDLGMSGLPARA